MRRENSRPSRRSFDKVTRVNLAPDRALPDFEGHSGPVR